MKIHRFDYANSILSLYIGGVNPMPWQVGQTMEPFTIDDERFAKTEFPGGAVINAINLGDTAGQPFTRYTMRWAAAKRAVPTPEPMPIPVETPPAE